MSFKVMTYYGGNLVSEKEIEDGEESFIHAARVFKSLGAPSVQAKNSEGGVMLFDPSGFSDVRVEIAGLYLSGEPETSVILNNKAEA